MGELKLLRQTGSVVDYQNKFLALLSCVDPLTDRQERQMFTTGLIEDLKDDVELAEPRDLDHVCTPTPTSSAETTTLARFAASRGGDGRTSPAGFMLQLR